jgi:hypothetical protein
VPVALLRELQLGADAVGRGDEDRVAEPGAPQVEQRAEPAEPGIRARPRGGAGKRGDRPDQRGGGVDIDARILVARPANRFLAPTEMLRCGGKIP